MPDLSFDEAVQHATQNRGAAYAFVPDGEPPKGGKLYVLAYNNLIEDDPDEWPYILWYTAGGFFDSSGEGDSYGPDDIPDEARSLVFTPAPPTFDTTYMDMELQVPLKLLQGASLTEALDDSDYWRVRYGDGANSDERDE